jgi:glycosyltransferase involved in cell wall biosynthesis
MLLAMSASTTPFQPGLLHRLWRGLPAASRRKAMTRLTALLAPRPAVMPPGSPRGVAIAGALSCPSGLGESARLMVRAARAMGVPTWPIDIPAPTAWKTTGVEPTTFPPPGVPLIMHVNAPVLPLALLRLPRALTRNRRIVGCWAWELSVVPAEWHAAVPLVHEIWVPSAFTARAIAPLKPHHVHIVPPALALAPPQPAALDRAAFGLPATALVVLVSFNLASSFERKNPLAAIAAFRQAFGTRMDRVLVVKVCYADHAPADFARIRDAAQAPNIHLIVGELPGPDRHALTAAADIVLSLHRAEGFGLVPAEAMLLGKPVVATGWSGNLDFMTAGNSDLVDFRLIPTEDDRGVYRDALWADADIADAAARLRRLADSPEERRRIGEQARLSTLQTLNGEPLRVAFRALGLTFPTAARASPPATAPRVVEEAAARAGRAVLID